MSSTKVEFCQRKLRLLFISARIQHSEVRFPSEVRFLAIKELLDYMMSYLSCMETDIFLVTTMKEHMTSYIKTRGVSEHNKEYVRNAQETLGFETYCCSHVGNYRCSQTIIDGEKNKYCELHKKILEIKSDRISSIIGSSDVSMLIAQYM
jgi:hypothetical protein